MFKDEFQTAKLGMDLISNISYRKFLTAISERALAEVLKATPAFAISISICRSKFTICFGLYLFIGLTRVLGNNWLKSFGSAAVDISGEKFQHKHAGAASCAVIPSGPHYFSRRESLCDVSTQYFQNS